MALKYLPQYFSTTLNVGGGIDSSQTTGIVMTSVSGLDITKAGQVCLTYSDPIDTGTAEWINYTSINGSNELQGVVRGREGFSAKSHLNQATAVFVLSASHINDLNDLLNGTTSGATLSSPTLTGTPVLPAKQLINAPYGNITTDTDGATITFDCSVTNRHRVVLGGNRALALSNYSSGQMVLLDLIQDSTGSRTVTWFSGPALTVTMTIATPGVITSLDIPTGTPVVFTTTGALPTGITASTTYYWVRQSSTTGNVATSLANAQAGTVVATSGSQSGLHTMKLSIRWPSQTAPTLSTGKYLIDTIGIYVVDATAGLFQGYTSGQSL